MQSPGRLCSLSVADPVRPDGRRRSRHDVSNDLGRDAGRCRQRRCDARSSSRRSRPCPPRRRRCRRGTPVPFTSTSGRPEVARRRCARLSAVQRRLEQAPHRQRRAGRRLVSLSVRAGARQHRRDGDVQGRRRLHDRLGAAGHGGLPQERRRADQYPRHALWRRPAVLLDDCRRVPSCTGSGISRRARSNTPSSTRRRRS